MMVIYFRLCDLNTLCNKRRHRDSTDSSSSTLSKKLKVKNKNKDNTSDSSSEHSSSPNSDLEIVEKIRDTHELGPEQERKMDQLLAQQVFNDLDKSNDEQSEDDEFEETDENLEISKKKNQKCENASESVSCCIDCITFIELIFFFFRNNLPKKNWRKNHGKMTHF